MNSTKRVLHCVARNSCTSKRGLASAHPFGTLVLVAIWLLCLPITALCQGDYGQACLSDGTCHNGRCDDTATPGIWHCVHCGDPGEISCLDSSGREFCNHADYEYGLSRGRICRSPNRNECGKVGYPPCYRPDGTRYCYTGVPAGNRGTATDYCEHCGFYFQPCCSNTDYRCDYGQCIGGLCRPTTLDQTVSKASGKIAECKFKEARQDINQLPVNDQDRKKLEGELQRAEQREREAVATYGQGQAANKAGRSSLANKRYVEARDYFQRANVLFKRALQQTGCPDKASTIKEAIAVTERNTARTYVGSSPLSEVDKKALIQMIDALGAKWIKRWCTPGWSGCAVEPGHVVSGLRFHATNASSRRQLDAVRRRASCCDGCMMGIVPGDKGAAARSGCLKGCDAKNPWPKD